MSKPCEQCPWRTINQGKRHPGGFYSKANLRRLWNQLRRGGQPQSCHLTDPSHPDHIVAGASANARAQECPGSVVLIIRELKTLAHGDECIDDKHVEGYLAVRRLGLTLSGIHYWLVLRASCLADTILGAKSLPVVDDEDPAIGLPKWLEERV